jgi:hypothetical protein
VGGLGRPSRSGCARRAVVIRSRRRDFCDDAGLVFRLLALPQVVTIEPANVAGDLADFPVLVALTDGDLQHSAQTDGDDLLFTAADGTTMLSHEIEKYGGAIGELLAWVKVPERSATTPTTLYLYYGKAAGPDQQDAAAVWDDGYVLVEHFEEISPCPTAFTDSTRHANDGSCVDDPQLVEGKIGDARSFDDVYDSILLPDSASLDSLGPAFTFEDWVKRASVDTWETIYLAGTDRPRWGIQIANEPFGNGPDFWSDTTGDIATPALLDDPNHFYDLTGLASAIAGRLF